MDKNWEWQRHGPNFGKILAKTVRIESRNLGVLESGILVWPTHLVKSSSVPCHILVTSISIVLSGVLLRLRRLAEMA